MLTFNALVDAVFNDMTFLKNLPFYPTLAVGRDDHIDYATVKPDSREIL